MARLTRRYPRRAVVAAGIGLSVLCTHPFAFAQAGKSGLSFLKLGVTPRAAAMGEAMVASASGTAATYYNPALLCSATPAAQIQFAHTEWIQDTRNEFLGATLPLGTGDALGFSLISSTVSDIEIRTLPGPPQATFTARNLAVSASYAHRWGSELRAGVTARFLYEKILIDDATGVGVDLGLAWQTPLDGLTVGASVAHLGRMSPLRLESTTLPATLRVGGAYVLPLGEGDSHALVAADIVHLIPEKSTHLSTGVEADLLGTIALRGGYEFGIEGRGLSLGMGVCYGIFALEYAYTQLREDLGTGHTVGLGVLL